MLRAVADALPGGELADWASLVGSLAGPPLLALAVIALWKQWVVPGAWLKALVADHAAALAAKDVLLAAKDQQLQAMTQQVMTQVVPAVTRATDVLRAYQDQVVLPPGGGHGTG